MFDLFFLILIWLLFAFFGKDAVTSMLYALQEAELTAKLRAYIEVKYPNSKIEYLLNCPYCLSYWCAGTLTVLYAMICFYAGMGVMITLLLSGFLLLTIVGKKIQDLKEKEK